MFLRRYETVVLINAEHGEEAVEKAITRFRDGLSSTQGQEIRLEDWGVRRIAYELNKVKRARYLCISFLGSNTSVAEIERLLGILESVIKFQTLFLEDRVDPTTYDFETEKNNFSQLAKKAKAKLEAQKAVGA